MAAAEVMRAVSTPDDSVSSGLSYPPVSVQVKGRLW